MKQFFILPAPASYILPTKSRLPITCVLKKTQSFGLSNLAFALRSIPIFKTLVLSCLLSSPLCLAQDITFKKLLADMVNRDLITVHPNGRPVDFTIHQAGSNDRSTTPQGDNSLGQPASFANLDFPQYIRTETGSGCPEDMHHFSSESKRIRGSLRITLSRLRTTLRDCVGTQLATEGEVS